MPPGWVCVCRRRSPSTHGIWPSFARGSGGGYLDSAGGASIGGGEKTRAVIRKQLDSSSDREKLDAMKKPFAVNTNHFFPFRFVFFSFLFFTIGY